MSAIITHTNPADCLQKAVWDMIPGNKTDYVYVTGPSARNLSTQKRLDKIQYFLGGVLIFYTEYSWDADGDPMLVECFNAPVV